MSRRIPAAARPARQPIRSSNASIPLIERIAAGSAAYAAAELAAGLLIGRLFDWGRAESFLFFAFRPWLLLAAALLVARFSWPTRYLFYAAAMLLAAASQGLLVYGLGATQPWPEAARLAMAGLLLATLIDLILQAGMRLRGRLGLTMAGAFIVMLLIVPGSLRPIEAVALGPTAPREQESKPELLLLSGLPLLWGEAGPFDRAGHPAEAYRALQREFTIRPIDHVDAEALGARALMLMAQPRALAPEELVAFDQWVRAGGRVLILADPMLVWPSELPLGDIRRPPPVSMIDPLLDHWGVPLGPAAERRIMVEHVEQQGETRRLLLPAPGRFENAAGQCAVGAGGWLARCDVGRGRATLVADADLLHDFAWVGSAAAGTERHGRVSDNMVAVATWLDELAGLDRRRADRAVAWAAPDASRSRALVLALIPILVGFAGPAAAAAVRFR